jgi:PAS domain S-box-containing protein
VLGLGNRSARKTYYAQFRAGQFQLERFRLLLDEVTDAIFLVELPSGTIVDVDRTAARQLGYGLTEMVGLPLKSFVTQVPAGALGAAGAMETLPMKAQMQAILAGKHGARIPVEISARTVAFHGGTYSVLIARDITERLRAEQQLVEAKDAAEAARRATNEFLSIAAHELRTPLMSLTLGLEVLRNKLASARDEVTPKSLDVLRRQANRLSRLASDLVDDARLERGLFTVAKETVDVSAVALELVRRAQERHPSRAIGFKAPGKVDVHGDPLRLEQALSNLVENALKYTDDGAPVDVEIDADATHVRIHVLDRGPGLPPEILERAFERFVRALRPTTTTPGLGLGLHIAREIVRLHGGTITAGNRAGGGSQFTIELPRPRTTPLG